MELGTLLLIIVVPGVILYIWYAKLISRRNAAREALSSIDVQLKKRHDLLPNILKLAGRFMTHEKDLLEGLTALRARVDAGYDPSDPAAVQAHLTAGQELQSGMARFFAVAENYPELRSAETITKAQDTFTEAEAHISAARRFYNAAVTDLNNAVEIFPGSMIAGWAKVKPMPFWEMEDTSHRAAVNVDDYLK
ncbi:LemA family protein [Denitrobaculum tricleocarpae]|uniref:LemA family protein n=1 Tax=Denitrobaculum tricleocarpae TaxID=2591009 RepID=A0A545TKT1_9PROT|nr:LemA family protein [Denitrobaculum tricleocarpae]TQV77771.1 LemA family protein [Denitrobaculum tricleocarpae]